MLLLNHDVMEKRNTRFRSLRYAARNQVRTFRRPGMKVLYTSGYTDSAIIHHGRLDPGVLLLTKPYRKAQLAQMVRQALSG